MTLISQLSPFRGTTLVVLALFSGQLFVSAGTGIVRGVAPNKLAMYTGARFRCLRDHHEMAADRVNDDVCDCEDGSDEPGKSHPDTRAQLVKIDTERETEKLLLPTQEHQLVQMEHFTARTRDFVQRRYHLVLWTMEFATAAMALMRMQAVTTPARCCVSLRKKNCRTKWIDMKLEQ